MATKKDLMQILKDQGVIFSEKESIAELKFRIQQIREAEKRTGVTSKKVKDPMSGLPNKLLATVQEVALGLQIPVKNPETKKVKTKGELLSELRIRLEEMHSEAVGFGKHALQTYEEAVLHKGYVEWAIEEAKKLSSGHQLRKFAMYARLCYSDVQDKKSESGDGPRRRQSLSKGPHSPLRRRPTRKDRRCRSRRHG